MAPRAGRRNRGQTLLARRTHSSSSSSPELRNRFHAFSWEDFGGFVGRTKGYDEMSGRRSSRESPSPPPSLTLSMDVDSGDADDTTSSSSVSSSTTHDHKLIIKKQLDASDLVSEGEKKLLGGDETVVVTSSSAGSKQGRGSRARRRNRRVVPFEAAPDFLKHNPYIVSGYRKSLTLGQCIRSCFWWTNESINIWSHILGVIWLFVILFMDIGVIAELAPSYYDVAVAVLMVLSFQACLSLSVVFHVFNCSSEKVCCQAFKWDVFGVAWATFTFYWTGIYCAYSCFSYWRYFYWITAFSAFCVTVGLHLWEEFLQEKYRPQRVIIFAVWAIFGFVPTFHWFFLYGGWSHPWVKTIVGRVLVLYVLLGLGFFFYLSRIPERFKPGVFDFVGSSHQWWHLFAVLSFWWWHNTGVECFRYLKVYGCPNLPGIDEDPWKPLSKLDPAQFNQTLLNITPAVTSNSSFFGLF